MKKSIAISIISILAIVLILFSVLYFTNNADKTKQIEDLSLSMAEKDKTIDSLTTIMEDKDGRIETLTSDVADKDGQIETLIADASEKTVQIESLSADVASKNEQITTLNSDVSYRDGQIMTLSADLKEKANKIDSLTEEITNKEKQIESLTADVDEKTKRIKSLESDIKALYEQCEENDTEIETKNKEIEKLGNQVKTDNAKIKELEEKIVMLNAQVETLTANNLKTSSDAKNNNLESAHYAMSDNLTTLNTVHFTMAVPSTWLATIQNGGIYYFATERDRVQGGRLTIIEMDALKYASYNEDEIHQMLSDKAEDMMGDKKGQIEHTNINGMNAVTVRFPFSDELFINSVLVFDNGYALLVSYSDENYDSTTSFDIANEYFKTINVVTNETSGSIQAETTVQTYPKSFTSALREHAKPLPDICYTTPASENGYGGFPCYVTGKVTKLYADGEVSESIPAMVQLETEKGPILFMVFSPDYLLKFDTSGVIKTEAAKKEYYNMFDTTMDYTLPSIGEEVCIYGVYSGFSGKFNMAVVDFGLDEFMYEQNHGTYSAEKYEK